MASTTIAVPQTSRNPRRAKAQTKAKIIAYEGHVPFLGANVVELEDWRGVENDPPGPDEYPIVRIDLTSPCIIHVGNAEVHLSPKQFDFLVALATRPGEVCTRAWIYSRLYDLESGPNEEQVDNLRRKMIVRFRPALGDRAEQLAELIRGVGFRCAYPGGVIDLVRE